MWAPVGVAVGPTSTTHQPRPASKPPWSTGTRATPPPCWSAHAQQRRAELAQALRALGGIADFIDNPANLPRIGRAADRVRELVDELQRDQQRRRPEREASDERC